MEENKEAEEQLATDSQDTSQHENETPQTPQESSNDRPVVDDNPDWREVRHIMSDQRSKIDSLEKEIAQFKQPANQGKDPIESMSEDDVVTVADMKRYASQVAQATAQEIYEKRSLEKEIEATPTKYSDYDDVMKFVEPLVKENPVLLHSIQNSPNQREAAYAIAKLYMKAARPGEASAKKIEENLSKPKMGDSLSLGSSLQGSGSKDLSLDEKAKIWEESQRYASMR